MTWDTWVTYAGQAMGLGKLCPHTVDKLIESAMEKALRRQVASASQRSEFEEGIFIEPISKLVAVHGRTKQAKSTDAASTPQAARHLRSTVVGAQWPQARKFKARLVGFPWCLKCGVSDGALAHRHSACRRTAEARSSSKSNMPTRATTPRATHGSGGWPLLHPRIGLPGRPTG